MQNNLEFIEVEVAYAGSNCANKQLTLKLKINNQSKANITIKEIIDISKILKIFPEINLNFNKPTPNYWNKLIINYLYIYFLKLNI